jgi:phosphoribosylformimino-5-aminoimidazole carboxamide ribotide isomerase
MQFRPCIDLHQGKVKQIVGSTYSDGKKDALHVNFQAEKPAEWYARLYHRDNLAGGHIIQLGSGNEQAAEKALSAWPGGMQIGGGINVDNAPRWIKAGAGAVIVTSWVFHDGIVNEERLQRMVKAIGKQRLVLDLSCRKKEDAYWVVTDRWQTITSERVNAKLLDRLARSCREFLIHAVDVEGKSEGIEKPLVDFLGDWGKIPITYAGGIHNMEDIRAIEDAGRGRIDFTVGSALDIFGGKGLKYNDLVQAFG